MDLESSLKNYLAKQDGGGRRIPYLAVIHRLDQPVEGILEFGKTPEAAKSLSAQITAGKMEKIYLAVTYGKQAEAGKKEKVLEDYLKKDGKSNTSSVVNAHTPGAKKARLSYEVLGEAVDAISGWKKVRLAAQRARLPAPMVTFVPAPYFRSPAKGIPA